MTMTEQSPQAPLTRVPVERIDDLMRSLQISCLRYPGTTTTVAIAVLPGLGGLPGFTVAEGHAYNADPAEFDARIGVTKATANAKDKARAMLWTLENYMLWTQRMEHAMDAGHRFSVAPPRPLHQQKVLDEKDDLDQRLAELTTYIVDEGELPGSVFSRLPAAEQELLRTQQQIMFKLSHVLAQRIAAFE
jgi:hypothetical protein